jgi:hypothetical protein
MGVQMHGDFKASFQGKIVNHFKTKLASIECVQISSYLTEDSVFGLEIPVGDSCKEVMARHFQNHAEHTNRMYGQNTVCLLLNMPLHDLTTMP